MAEIALMTVHRAVCRCGWDYISFSDSGAYEAKLLHTLKAGDDPGHYPCWTELTINSFHIRPQG